jgi:cytosine/adenosine deaminase-related metal-dependent hydrolase
MLRFRSVLALSLIVVSAGPMAAQERLAIKGGKILPVSGPPIDGGVILIRGGKIEAVGKDLAISSEAKVIDATGKVVVPGFIEAHTTRGMDQVNESNPNVPFLSVVDAIDPSQDYFEECRRNGVTTVAVVPGNNTMFGGQAAVIKTAGTYVNEMVVKRGVGIKISLRPPNDRNRMGHLATLRRELDGARDSLASAKPAGGSTGGAAATPDSDDGERATQQQPGRGRGGRGAAAPQAPADADTALVREALVKLLKGDVLAFIYCELAMDVPQAIKLVNDYKLKAVLVLGQDCYKAVRLIAASKLPVVLDPTLVFWETDQRTGEDRQIILPRVYREAGVPVTFQVTGGAAGSLFRAANLPPTVGTNYLWYQAATAVKYGTPAAEALEAITLRPAKTLGVEKLAGSIEPGKDADLAILTGDPLKLDTWVETTIVAGRVVYERDQDRKLKQLLAPSAK